MDLNKYLLDNRNSMQGSLISPRINCADGFNISVQANVYAYCSPREDYSVWTTVECGFPSSMPELIMEYAEDSDGPTETVYGYVPIELVEELIELHGGMV